MSAVLAQRQEPMDDPIQLAAVDSLFYSKYFFPKTVRQDFAPFHRKVWSALERPNTRLVNLMVMRDGAKTTQCRIFASKRIAYAISRTILYVGKSEAHALRSVGWIRNQVLNNSLWAQTFQLKKGSKFQDHECQILHGVEELPIWILGVGIEGSVRGINLDDYRPDLIILDDVIDDENAATVEGRKKTSERVHGAIKESLAPESESPDAKLVMLNTPIAREDASQVAMTDPEWYSMRVGCWTEDTENLPLEQRKSSWEARYSSQVLIKRKQFAIQAGRAHIFNREKECRITSPETSDLRPEWLRFWEVLPERSVMDVIFSVDPVPKPTKKQLETGLVKKDFEAWTVWGRVKHEYYLLDYVLNKGHEPDWSVMQAFRLYIKWRPRLLIAESVAYQSTLAWLIQQAQKAKGCYFLVDEADDLKGLSKYHRIIDAFQGAGAQGAIHVHPSHVDFISQWNEYPDVANDDLLDASAMAVLRLQQGSFDLMAEVLAGEEDTPSLGDYRKCP